MFLTRLFSGRQIPFTMQLTRECDYALVVLVALVGRESQPVSSADMARELSLPVHFLAKILQKLSRAGLVVSREGVSGGYHLAKAPAAITVADVLRATDEPLRLVECALGDDCGCPRVSDCAIVESMQALHRKVIAIFEDVTIADLVPLPSRSVRATARMPGSGRQ